MQDDAQEIDAYVRRLLWALQALPHDDRLGIASEIHDHLSECARRGPAELEQAMGRLGRPDMLARSYVEEYELAGALNRASPLRLMLAMIDRAGRSAIACVGGFGAFVLYSLSASFAVTAVGKLVAPSYVGAWRLEHGLQFGIVGAHPPAGGELLGLWIVPLCAALAWLSFIAAGGLLRAVGGRMLAKAGRAAREGARPA